MKTDCFSFLLVFNVGLYSFIDAFASERQCMEEWHRYKKKYNKSYTPYEDRHRMRVFKERTEFIRKHNEEYAKGSVLFHLRENHLTDQELHEMHLKVIDQPRDMKPQLFASLTADLPVKVDWREKGIISKVKNQGNCGSCWAFATADLLESYYAKTTGHHVTLSEQYLVDCGYNTGNDGCFGGNTYLALQTVEYNGIPTEKNYPYSASGSQGCFKNVKMFRDMKVTNIYMVGSSESNLERAVATVGPMAIAIDSNHTTFQQYGGGIYHERECSPMNLNHAMLLVGYGEENGRQYWLLKNSWGTGWGEDGYMRMIRKEGNDCGIDRLIIYPGIATFGEWDDNDGISCIRPSLYFQLVVSMVFILGRIFG